MMHKITIEGMSCQHCVRAVTDALKAIDGITDVEVSLENKEAAFQAPDNQDIEQVKKAVSDAGYKVV